MTSATAARRDSSCRRLTAAPAYLAPLVGREGDVGEVLGLLAHSRVLTLTGPPGVGKSRLAIEAAVRLDAVGSGQTVVVSLGSVASPELAGPTVLRALEGAEGTRRLGDDAAIIVVLDDCDALLPVCGGLVRMVLARGARVLATSREPLGIPTETTWRVRSLPLPEAVRLFCGVANSVDPGFVAAPPVVAAICRQLDGIPLALELAAHDLTTFSPQDIAVRLVGAPFSVLPGGASATAAHHQSLWAAIGSSFDRLSLADQLLLERLSAFPRSFTAQAVLKLCAPLRMSDGDVLESLEELVGRSLVEVDAHSGVTRYRLLEMIRRFATNKRLARQGMGGPRVSGDRQEPLSGVDIIVVGCGSEENIPGEQRSTETEREPLTARERQVAELTAQGLTNVQIARALSIAQDTVKTHLKNVFQKLEVKRRTELAARILGIRPGAGW
jgi:predicted ATPase/DNA-binding CsgD family transcriptional regulator